MIIMFMMPQVFLQGKKRRSTFPSFIHLTDEYVHEKTIHLSPFMIDAGLFWVKQAFERVLLFASSSKAFFPHWEKKLFSAQTEIKYSCAEHP